jgi:mono/diheme cytochrome c family protein
LIVLLALVLGACGDDDVSMTPAPEASPEIAASAHGMTDAGANAPSAAEPRAPEPGAGTYAQYCADCHDRGHGHPGTMRLAMRLDNPVLRTRTDLAPEYVKWVVRNGYQMMPPFRPTEITDSELETLARFVSAATLAAGNAQ